MNLALVFGCWIAGSILFLWLGSITDSDVGRRVDRRT